MRVSNQVLCAILIGLNVHCAVGISGYDCSYQGASYKKIDLTQIGECNRHATVTNVSTEMIQLIQLTDTAKVSVYHCRVEVSRQICHCGMHSHCSAVDGGYMAYMYTLGREKCKRAVQSAEACIFCHTSQDIIFSNLKYKQDRTQQVIFAGNTDHLGNCKGGHFSDPFGTWDNVVAQGFIKVHIDLLDAVYDTKKNKIHLINGITCDGDRGECNDSGQGEFYWSSIDDKDCTSDRYEVIYQGPSNYTTGTNGLYGDSERVVTVIKDQTAFSLRLTQQQPLCGITAFGTEHPRLIILFSQGMEFYFKKKPIGTQSMDLFTYVNSKFVFVERNVQMNMVAMYKSLMYNKCQLDLSLLRQKMSYAQNDPLEFAYLHTGGAGYTATRLGEVVYLTKCQEIIATSRRTEACYQELPVLYKNASYFLTPKYRLIQKHGTEVNCNSIYAPMFEHAGKWYMINKGLVETSAPEILQPGSHDTEEWTYQSIGSLASSGIYTQDELDNLRDHIMYGQERQAVQNILVRSSSGHRTDMQDVKPLMMFGTDDVEELAQKVHTKLWGWLSAFGNLTAGIIGLISIFKIFKWIVDSVINGTILLEVYGFSYHLLACGLDSLTACLLHQKLRRDVNKTHLQETHPLQSVITEEATAPAELVVQEKEVDRGDHLWHTHSVIPSPSQLRHDPNP